MSDVTIATSANGLATDVSSGVEYEIPAVTFERIKFSDGTTVELSPDDVVVFVGPNNAGKSVALRELREFVRDSEFDSTVVKKAPVVKAGSLEQLEQHIAENSEFRFNSRGVRYLRG